MTSKIEIKQGKPRHPWVNGQAERSIRTLQTLVERGLQNVKLQNLSLEEFQIILEIAVFRYNNQSN